MITDLVKSENPLIKTLVNSQSRYFACDQFRPLKKDGKRLCAWCRTNEIPSKHHAAKYCSDECRKSIYIFCYPSGDDALMFHLQRQNHKCDICAYDWAPVLADYRHIRKKRLEDSIKREISFMERCFSNRTPKQQKNRREYIDRLKWELDNINELPLHHFYDGAKVHEIRPEIDHIIPISLGGTALGVDNHHVICHICHTGKTANDMAELRKGRQQAPSL